ncbi:LysR family transcriptional regulator [Vibrio harveyi]
MPRASFDQLTAFVAVAEHGSFSQAARVIGKDRATLHHQVSDLEIDWDVILFERKGKTPVLTEVGVTLVTQAKHILYQMQSLELSCDSYSQGDVPEITICHDMSVPCDAIADIDLSLRKQYKNTAIHWLHRSRDEALDMLMAKHADFAVVLNSGKAFPTEGMSFINLGYPRFTFYAHRKSSIAQNPVVTLQDLASHHQYIAEAVIPLSAALVQKGMALGSVMALIIGSAGASLTEVILLKSIFKNQMIAAFLFVILSMAMGAGYLYSFIFA